MHHQLEVTFSLNWWRWRWINHTSQEINPFSTPEMQQNPTKIQHTSKPTSLWAVASEVRMPPSDHRAILAQGRKGSGRGGKALDLLQVALHLVSASFLGPKKLSFDHGIKWRIDMNWCNLGCDIFCSLNCKRCDFSIFCDSEEWVEFAAAVLGCSCHPNGCLPRTQLYHLPSELRRPWQWLWSWGHAMPVPLSRFSNCRFTVCTMIYNRYISAQFRTHREFQFVCSCRKALPKYAGWHFPKSIQAWLRRGIDVTMPQNASNAAWTTARLLDISKAVPGSVYINPGLPLMVQYHRERPEKRNQQGSSFLLDILDLDADCLRGLSHKILSSTSQWFKSDMYAPYCVIHSTVTTARNSGMW